MNFEELEDLWSKQPVSTPRTQDIAALEKVLLPEARRRGRMLTYGVCLVAFGLVVFPLLALANARHSPPDNPAWHWFYLGVWMTVYTVGLIYMVRQLRRQRALFRQSADTLRSLTLASLASCEAEMRDYRRGLWLVPVIMGAQLVNLAMKFPFSEYGWEPFTARAGSSLGFVLVIGAAFWRHYQVNLKPSCARQREMLRHLS